MLHLSFHTYYFYYYYYNYNNYYYYNKYNYYYYYYYYYSRKANRWVIDDILESEGPVYSTSSSSDLCAHTTQWVTSPGWKSSRRQILVARIKAMAGFRGEGVSIQGCGQLRNGSCTAQEDGLYLRQAEGIDGQAHYVKESSQGRRHLFWDRSKGGWQVSDM
jgi:hypothetical protein